MIHNWVNQGCSRTDLCGTMLSVLDDGNTQVLPSLQTKEKGCTARNGPQWTEWARGVLAALDRRHTDMLYNSSCGSMPYACVLARPINRKLYWDRCNTSSRFIDRICLSYIHSATPNKKGLTALLARYAAYWRMLLVQVHIYQ
jgi:hypothetical protein